MLCKYYLQLNVDLLDPNAEGCMDVSDMIKNLDSIKVTYARVDLGGVVRKCGSDIEFVSTAYHTILSYYKENYLQSKGVFAVFIADNNWHYSKVWECPLDFSTLRFDANVLSIGCIDNSAAATIKAYKKSKFEFYVNQLKEPNSLLYNGVTEKEDFKFFIVGSQSSGTIMKSTGLVGNVGAFQQERGRTKCSAYFPFVTATETGKLSQFTCQTQDEYATIASVRQALQSCFDFTKQGFIKCNAEAVLHLKFDIDFWFAIEGHLSSYNVDFLLVSFNPGNGTTGRGGGRIGTQVLVGTLPASRRMELHVDKEIRMYPGQQLAFCVYLTTQRDDDYYFDLGMLWDSNENTGYAEKNSEILDPKYINVIKPKSLLDKIMSKMFNDSYCYCVTKIEEDTAGILPRTLILAAESVRRISNAMIHTSFADFCKFMEVVFGYVYTIDEVGYYMDRELAAFDKNDLDELSHIRMANIKSQSYFSGADAGYYKMLPIGGVTEQPLGNKLDTTTMRHFVKTTQMNMTEYISAIQYASYENVFVLHDPRTNMYYSMFTLADMPLSSDMYNDYTGQAREMIGLNIGTFDETDTEHQYGVIRGGSLLFCNALHSRDWLDCEENNRFCTELTFKHRRDVFSGKLTKTIPVVNNISYEIDDSLAFSDIEVGYPKKDYSNDNNAKNEFNLTTYYKTNCNMSEQTLSLVCPYRADCYGTQELINKSRDSESTESDNDVFVVIASASAPIGNNWQLDRSVPISGVFSPETMFNAAIAPNKIILNNEEYIGACINPKASRNPLVFTSSDGNSSATIGGVPMKQTHNIKNQLFKAGKITIDTDDHDFPENWEGVVEFQYEDHTYQGYLDSIDINFANLGTITYNLIEKCIE